MNNKTQKRIDGYFEQLEKFIKKLPLNNKGRNYIWFDSFCKFYDEPVLSENGSTTYGIQTEWQLQRFIEQFKNNFQKLRLKSIEKWTDELNNIEPSEAVGKIDKQLYELRKKKLFTEIGGEGLNDWQKWSIKYLSHEIDHHQKRPSRKAPKQQKKISYKWQGNPDKDLPEFYNLMIKKYKLIASDTTPEQFKAIFTGQLVDKGFVPIKWHEDNASELLYFINRLEQSKNIACNPKRADYQRMSACFVTPDGNKFNAVWKSLKTNLEINLSLEKQKTIDELVNNF